MFQHLLVSLSPVGISNGSVDPQAICNAFVTVMGLFCSLHLLTCLWFGVGRLPGGWVTCLGGAIHFYRVPDVDLHDLNGDLPIK